MIIFLQAAIGGTIRVTPLLTALICGYYLFNNNNLQPNRLPTTNAPTNATTPSTSTLTSSLESLINRESPLAQILVNVSLVLAIMFSWPILTFFIPSLAGWLTGPLPILPIIGAIIFYLSYTQQQRRRATTNSAPPPTLHSGVSAPSPEQALNPTTALPNNAALPQPSNRSEYSLESQDVTIIPSIPRPSESTAAAAVISSLADNSNINNNSDPINLTNNPPTTSLNAPLPRKRTLQ
jgi:hypothetical protein